MLRSARACDHPTIAALWRAAWSTANPDAPTLAPLEHWLERVQEEFTASHEVWVQEEHGNVCAFHVLNPRTRWLDQLHVHPNHQRRGLGQVVLNQLCERFPEGWSLYVATENLRAKRFYERFGMHGSDISRNPISGRSRIRYSWSPAELT
jgi:putative acetyltransferase